MRYVIFRRAFMMTLVWLAAMVGIAPGTDQTPASEKGAHAMNIPFNDFKWEKIVPELGDRSPEIAKRTRSSVEPLSWSARVNVSNLTQALSITSPASCPTRHGQRRRKAHCSSSQWMARGTSTG